MKISEVKTYIMDSPGRDYLFVKISTDEGIHGWGEGTLEMRQGTVAAAVHDLEGFVVGEDPTRIDFLWQRMYRHGFWRGGVAILSAISAIEHALWDITGKAYGQPVYKLLGGAVRDYQPDICHDGGIKETLKIAAMAELNHMLVAPHNPNGPVATAAFVHAAAPMPNFLILEYALTETRDACQAAHEPEQFKARAGRIELPSKPGLGIELDEEYLAGHPYTGIKLWGGFRYADGGVADV
jgi:L-alanine-DL-glutamate epimerase-like enolase superfamily enzyme